MCKGVTMRDASQDEAMALTVTSDRKGECFEPKAQTATNDRMCPALNMCDAVEYESMAPSATSERMRKEETMLAETQN